MSQESVPAGQGPKQPDDTFPVPDGFTEGSVWADRVGTKSFIGRNRRGVEIPIGKGDGEIDPGELLKLALIGCAGMSSDFVLSRRLGEDFPFRLWVHGSSDPDANRYAHIHEELQLELGDLEPEDLRRLGRAVDRAIESGCTVQRTVEPGLSVDHEIVSSPAVATDETTGDATEEDDAR
jgi:uncharacterized OsmC-like protein